MIVLGNALLDQIKYVNSGHFPIYRLHNFTSPSNGWWRSAMNISYFLRIPLSIYFVRSWWQAVLIHLDLDLEWVTISVSFADGYGCPAANLIYDILGALYCSQSVTHRVPETMNGAANGHMPLEPFVKSATR